MYTSVVEEVTCMRKTEEGDDRIITLDIASRSETIDQPLKVSFGIIVALSEAVKRDGADIDINRPKLLGCYQSKIYMNQKKIT